MSTVAVTVDFTRDNVLPRASSAGGRVARTVSGRVAFPQIDVTPEIGAGQRHDWPRAARWSGIESTAPRESEERL
ncbi:MAG TPA: hypothetical protein PLA46_05905 [Phycicoccus sp.]|jgi:hypothetical protein|nr:hypothetical protein [Phycicoccus sp.]